MQALSALVFAVWKLFYLYTMLLCHFQVFVKVKTSKNWKVEFATDAIKLGGLLFLEYSPGYT